MQGKANMNRVVICIFSVLLFGCSTQPPILQTTSPTIYSVTHPITSFPSLTPTTKPTNTVPPTSTIVPTPALPEAELEKANRLRLRWEYNQEKKDWELIDEMGFILGVFLDNQLLLIDEKFDVIQAGEPEFIHGNDDEKSPVIMTAWDQLALWLRGITPLVSNGIVCMSDGETVTVPIPPGSKQVVNQPMVELSDASLLIYQFNTDDNVVIGENDQGQYMAATFKDGQITEPVMIQFEPGSEIITRVINNQSIWIEAQDGQFQQAFNLENVIHNIDNEEIKNNFMDRMGFDSWEQVMTHGRQLFSGQQATHNNRNFKTDVVSTLTRGFEGQKGSNRALQFEALGIGWKITHHQELNKDLIQLFFINPTISSELMSAYIGYIDNSNTIRDFIGTYDESFDYSPYTYQKPFSEVLDELSNGKTFQLSISLFSYLEPNQDNLSKIFTQIHKAPIVEKNYAEKHGISGDEWAFDPTIMGELALSENYYQLMSDDEIRDLFEENDWLNPFNDFLKGVGGESYIGEGIAYFSK